MPLTIRHNDFFRNILTLMGGTSLAQLIPIALQPLLRRLFEPEVFGAFSLYLTYVSVLVVISCLKWEMAIVIEKEQKKAINITGLALFTSFLINTVVLLAGIIFFDSLVDVLRFPAEYAWWLLFIPVSAWLLSSYQALNYWLVRRKSFMLISANKIVRRGSEGLVQSGAGFASFAPGMLIGDLIGNMANVVAGVFQSTRKGLSFKKMNFPAMRQVAGEQIDFPKYQALPALLTTFSISLPVIIVNKYFGALELSYFDLSRMVLLVPSALIAVSVSQVLFQNISEKIKNNSRISGLILKTSSVLLILAGGIVLIMFLAGPNLFGLVFDQKYAISGQYSKLLSVAFMSQFIVSPVSITLTALKKLKTMGAWQVLYFLSMLSLLFVNFESMESFIRTFMIVNLAAYLICWLLAVFHALKHDRKIALIR